MDATGRSLLAKRIRGPAAALAVAGLLWLGHGWLLYLAARPLVCDEPFSGAAFLCLQGSEFGIEGAEFLPDAVAWQRESEARRLLLLEPCPRRVAAIGVIPSFAEICRRELRRQGVPDSAALSLAAAAGDDWDKAHFLADWLRQHPGENVALLCARFHSGQARYVFSRVLGSEARRVRIVASPLPGYDEHSWWRTRAGVRNFMFAWLDRGYSWWQGEQAARPEKLTAAQYMALLKHTYGEAPP
jgi:hypothetical protein